MRKIIRFIYQKLKFTVFNDIDYEQSILCGLHLKTIKGTVRKKVDQDDAWFFYLAKNNDVIFDIGANVGYTALLALIQNKDRRYILADPNPLALADANKNLLMNSIGYNASYIPSFVADKKGEEVKFYTIGTGAAGSIYKSHAETASRLNSWFYVNTITLDSLYNYYNIIPDLVKIDVEGAESMVLEGAYELAKKSKTLFFVEMHANADISMIDNATRILSWCKKVNYSPWYMKHKERLLRSDQIAHRGKCHLLLMPDDSKYPNYLKYIDQSTELPLNLDN